MHPLYPQGELRAYCEKEGILLQAYASLGGQDGSKAKWQALGGKLLEAQPVTAAATAHRATPAQVLLRWALAKGAAVVPKSANEKRMIENACCVTSEFQLSEAEVSAIDALAATGHDGRLCWKTDPLRHMDFD